MIGRWLVTIGFAVALVGPLLLWAVGWFPGQVTP